MDELQACTQYLLDYRQSCLICVTESWLTDPDSTADLEGFSLVRMDRNQNSGKSMGGGVCVCVLIISTVTLLTLH